PSRSRRRSRSTARVATPSTPSSRRSRTPRATRATSRGTSRSSSWPRAARSPGSARRSSPRTPRSSARSRPRSRPDLGVRGVRIRGRRPSAGNLDRTPMDEPTPEPPITFESLGVSERLVKVLADQGITEPFAIQRLSIADALAGRDVCGKAKTGSGKTLAFGLPLLERLERAAPRRPPGPVLVPTRALALQAHDVLAPPAEAVGLPI